MSKTSARIAAALVIVCGARAAWAIEPPGAVASGIEGVVGVQRQPGAKFERLQVGDPLPFGAVLCTAMGGRARVQIGAGPTLTVDQLTRLTIVQRARADGALSTNINVAYGRVRYEGADTVTGGNRVIIGGPDSDLVVTAPSAGIDVAAGFETGFYGCTPIDRESSTTGRPHPGVEVGDARSRSGDETAFVAENAAVFQQSLGVVQERPEHFERVDYGSLYAYVESSGTPGTIVQFMRSPSFDDPPPSVVGRPTNFDSGAVNVGAAIREGPNGPQFLRLESDGAGSSQVLAFDLGPGERPASIFGSFAASLSGLATLGQSIYAIQQPGGWSSGLGADRIVELDATRSRVVPVMELGVGFESLGIHAYRGTLLAAGRLPELAGLDNGVPGYLGRNAAIFELHPGSNYVSRVLSDIGGDFAVSKFSGGVPDSLNPALHTIGGQVVTGVSASPYLPPTLDFVTGRELFILVNMRATVDGVPSQISVILDGDALGVPEYAVWLAGVSLVPVRSFARGGALPGATPVLSPAPLHVDASVPRLFAQLAYSRPAVDSGVLTRLALNAVLATGGIPGGVTGSAASLMLSELQAHIEQRAGMGAAIYDFRLDMGQFLLAGPRRLALGKEIPERRFENATRMSAIAFGPFNQRETPARGRAGRTFGAFSRR